MDDYQFVVEMDKKPILINTDDRCFLCRKDDSCQSSILPLKMLMACLKLDLKKVFKLETAGEWNVRNVPVLVTLCRECQLMTEQFQASYVWFECYKLHLEDCVRNILKTISSCDNDQAGVAEWNQLISGFNDDEKRFDFEIANDLRKEIKEKLQIRARRAAPQVKLHKLSDDTRVPHIKVVKNEPSTTRIPDFPLQSGGGESSKTSSPVPTTSTVPVLFQTQKRKLHKLNRKLLFRKTNSSPSDTSFKSGSSSNRKRKRTTDSKPLSKPLNENIANSSKRACNALECSYCSETFNLLGCLANHTLTKHRFSYFEKCKDERISLEKFKNIVDKVLDKVNTSKITKREDKQFQCAFCQMIIGSRRNAQFHITRIHCQDIFPQMREKQNKYISKEEKRMKMRELNLVGSSVGT